MPSSLADRHPDPPVAELIAELAPPRRFADVRFSTYQPAHPSQAVARDRLVALGEQLTAGRPSSWLGRLRARAPGPAPCVYLDGGFGVGKTHLLASLWHAVQPAGVRALYTTFRELVGLVGALSMPRAVAALGGVRLVCLDEFELDDPANTRLIATLLRALVEDGASVVATSNTLPTQQGRGRFDAQRFRREIETLAASFEVVEVDGEDYRHRGLRPPAPWAEEEVTALAYELGERATLDKLDTALAALANVHPVRYPALVDGLAGVFLLDARPVDDLNDALRLAYLIDVLYDAEVPAALSGVEVGSLFAPEFLRGGYAKLLGRAISRLGALLGEAAALR